MTVAIALPEQGDRLRVFIEGEVSGVFDGSRELEIGNSLIRLDDEQVKSVEVVPPLPERGDEIDNLDAVAALPVGTVVVDDAGDIGKRVDATEFGWETTGSEDLRSHYWFDLPVEVLIVGGGSE